MRDQAQIYRLASRTANLAGLPTGCSSHTGEVDGHSYVAWHWMTESGQYQLLVIDEDGTLDVDLCKFDHARSASSQELVVRCRICELPEVLRRVRQVIEQP